VGIDGLFLEVHPEPERAISDAANQLRLTEIRTVLQKVAAIANLQKEQLQEK
jgi:2-dehydro-3-deoxyphosphooctonate aldolase (KDO 8-P synthase)